MNKLEERVDEFEDWYNNNLAYHHECLSFICKLVDTLPLVEKVSGRIKTREECINKFISKYLSSVKTIDRNLLIADYIPDLIGVRAVCFYTEEVNLIRNSLYQYFIELDSTDKSAYMERSENKFGYKSLHLNLELKKNQKNIPKEFTYKSLSIELQIRTVIQDAWSILDHEINYKNNIPQNLIRRINRLAALFELADEEFLSVKKEIEQQVNRDIKEKKKKSFIHRFKIGQGYKDSI